MQLLKILLSITEITQNRPVNNLSNPHVPYDLSTAFYGPPGQRNIFGDYSKGGLFKFELDICVIFLIADYQSACQAWYKALVTFLIIRRVVPCINYQ